jgi:type I restriction enzyme S subunit
LGFSDNLPYEKVGKNEPVCIADEVPFDIPESWEWVRLKTLTYNHGQKKPTSEFCYIDIGSIDNKHQKLNEQETIVVPEKAASRARKIVNEGDILYSTVRPYLHNMCIINREFSREAIASTGFAVLKCCADYSNEFLFYYMMSPDFDSYANDTANSKGVAYPAINDERLSMALVPIPPVSEQRRILKQLLEILPTIQMYDITHQRLEKLNDTFPAQLKKSILQDAVQGKLVLQDPADEPASALLERIRAEKEQLIKEGKIKRDKHESVIFRRDNSYYEKVDGIERCIDDEIPFEIPKNWEWCRLGTILQKLTDGTHSTPKYAASGIPFISVKDISSGKISFESTKFISEEEHELLASRCDPHRDDILLTKVGTTGIPVLVDTDRPFSIFVSVAQLRFSTELLDKFFLIYLLKSPLVQTQCRENTKGVGNKNWVMRDIANTLICIPPLAEQKRIQASLANVLKSI